jgi:hypothetical protein
MIKPPQKYKFEFLIKERIIDDIKSSPTLVKFAKNSIIELGEGFSISIQASEFHHSTPRKTLLNNSDYSEFEFLIMKDEYCAIVITGILDFVDYGIYNLKSPKDDSVIFIEDLESEKYYGVYYSKSDITPIASYVRGEYVDFTIDVLNNMILKLKSRNVLFEKTKKPEFYSPSSCAYLYKF